MYIYAITVPLETREEKHTRSSQENMWDHHVFQVSTETFSLVHGGKPQIQLHKYHDTEYESILNSPLALCLVNEVTHHHPLCRSGSIHDHPIRKSMFIILKIQNQSRIQSKCQIQTLKTQHSAFPVQRSSPWMTQNFKLQINSKIFLKPFSYSIQVPNSNKQSFHTRISSYKSVQKPYHPRSSRYKSPEQKHSETRISSYESTTKNCIIKLQEFRDIN